MKQTETEGSGETPLLRMNQNPKSLNVLPTTGAAGKLAELRAQPSAPAAAPAKKLNDETPIDRALNASLSPEQRRIKEKIIEALQQVYDPELPVNLYDLGLIYRLDLRDAASDDEATGGGGGRVEGRGAEPVSARAVGQIVEIDMTLTTPGCPVSDALPSEARQAVAQAMPQFPVRVNIVWDPPWTPDRMNVDTARTLGLGRKLRI